MAEEEEEPSSSSSPMLSLEQTPTWAVAVVCFVMVSLSILIEHLLHRITLALSKKKKKSLNKALYTIKSELMVFGFITLSLTVAQQPIAKICVPRRTAESFLPCGSGATLPADLSSEEASCIEKGKISLLSEKGVNQLQTLIFSLALSHVISCLLTMGLALAKMKRWKRWEEETTSSEYQFSHDPRRFKLVRQTSIGRRHLRFWSSHRLLRWPVCFVRQFTGSVSKPDYFALRAGFLLAYVSPESKFDFHKFLRRALDDDFVMVVGTNIWNWVLAVLFIFFSANGFGSHFWLPFIPLIILLLIGTKLGVIITDMCLENSEHAVFMGTFLVRPDNEFFWFNRPRWLLHLVHIILFQNSFQLAFFAWTWIKFGLRSCFHRSTEDIILRIVIGGLVQLLSGYITLPLYVLVTQMGSLMNKSIFTERISKGLKNWRSVARQNLAKQMPNPVSPSRGPSPSFSIMTSPSTTCSNSPTTVTLLDDSYYNTKSKDINSNDQHNPRQVLNRKIETEERKEETADNSLNYNGEISFGW